MGANDITDRAEWTEAIREFQNLGPVTENVHLPTIYLLSIKSPVCKRVSYTEFRAEDFIIPQLM